MSDGTLDQLETMALAGETFEAGCQFAMTGGPGVAEVLLPGRAGRPAGRLGRGPPDRRVRPRLPAVVLPLVSACRTTSCSTWPRRGASRRTSPGNTGPADAGGPEAERFFEDFAGQWLRTRNILLAPVSGRVQAVVDPLRAAMSCETDMLFEYVAREDRDLTELLTADYTFLNERLAAYYGVRGVKGDEMRRVSCRRTAGGAESLTHASVLIVTSNPNRTSPVKRGLFVLENLLGWEVPPRRRPGGNLEDAKGTRRASSRRRCGQLAAHRSRKPAPRATPTSTRWAVVGELRTDRPVAGQGDTAARSTRRRAADRRGRFKGGELKASCGPEGVFYQCLTEKLLTYALGRGWSRPTPSRWTDRGGWPGRGKSAFSL